MYGMGAVAQQYLIHKAAGRVPLYEPFKFAFAGMTIIVDPPREENQLDPDNDLDE